MPQVPGLAYWRMSAVQGFIMIKVYDASNSIEAHMIANMLEQEGIEARVDGEYLQGGIGDLQAIDMIRVMVSEESHPAAQNIIKAFEAKQPRDETAYNARNSNYALVTTGLCLVSFLLGVISASLMYYIR